MIGGTEILGERIIKKIMLLCFIISIIISYEKTTSVNVLAATTTCNTYNGENTGKHNYKVWSSVINSYLQKCDNGDLMRVQAGATESGVLVEYYDSEYNYKNTIEVTNDLLPIFGGFYSTGTNYYILSGQENPTLNNYLEVFRITKYDLNWNSLGHTGLCGNNTCIPFHAGSARMTSSGNFLFIRTCHELYNHHQANVTIQLDMNKMEITDYLTGICYSGEGYISHSFNQFIKTDGINLIGVDHGDAYPRAFVLCKYISDYTSGLFISDDDAYCNVVELLTYPIPNTQHYNYTGASIGGFEISSDNYIVVGNTIDQSNIDDNTTRNIFVATVDRNLSSVPVVHTITDYAEGTSSATTPHLIKLSDNQFILMWSRKDTVYWTSLDSFGNQTDTIYEMQGSLSDCVPIIYNDKLVWYVWDNKKVTFYDINTQNLGTYNKTELLNGHENVIINSGKITNNKVSVKCKRCGQISTVTVPSNITVYAKKNSKGKLSTSFDREFHIGESLSFVYSISPQDVDKSDISFIVSDKTIASYDESKNILYMLSPGTFTFTIKSKYNSSVDKKYNFTVLCDKHIYNNGKITKKPTLQKNGEKTFECKVCKHKKKQLLPKLKKQKITVNTNLSKTVSLTTNSIKKKAKTYNIKAKAKTTLSYKLTKGNKRFVTVDSKGKITVKKGTKPGKYQITITAKETLKYAKSTKVITIIVK